MTKRSGIFLKSITFNDGTILPLDRSSIVIVTGPNNCGKSQTLREIMLHPVLNQFRVVTAAIEGVFDGNLNEIVDGLLRHPALKQNRAFFESHVATSQGQPSIFLTLMASNPHFYKPMLNGFMSHLSTTSRLISLQTTANPFEQINIQPFNTIGLDRIYEDNEVAKKIYDYTKSIFGKGVLMNHASFQDQELYFFDKDKQISPESAGKVEHARWFEKQEKISQQGDGVLSFSAILISIMQQRTPLILLDEPEAFLHPPQIREIARLISREISSDTQLIVSTHSDDFIRGMIEFAGTRTSVVRMTRANVEGREVNRIRRLDAAQISNLWNDPLLKTSDVLTSLFHQVAVIVEGDSDARFFRAMVDVVVEEGQRSLDLRFYHCGGKDKIPKILSALRAIGIATICIVDIDALDDKGKFLGLIDASGGDRNIFDKPIADFIQFIAQKRPSLSAAEIKSQIDKIFDDVELSKPPCPDTARKLGEVVKIQTAWSQLKQGGASFLSGGEPFNNFQFICQQASKIGVLINQIGELENFCKSISAKKKNEWLAEVLTKDLRNDPALSEAREFTKALVDQCRQASS